MTIPPVITIFVRHSPDCRHRKNELYQNCRCRKHLRWSQGGKQYRVSAKTRRWEEAEREQEKIATTLSSAPVAAPSGAVRKTNLTEAVTSFIDSKRSQGLNAHVISKYERELGRFVDFAKDRGKAFPAEITLDDLIAFRANWAARYPSATTRQKVQERLRGFFRYCYEAGHISRVPNLSPIKPNPSATVPLSDDEYTALLKAAIEAGQAPKKGRKPREGKGLRLHALIRLMRHSGLAIRDAVTLECNEILRDHKKSVYRIVTARQKTGTHVSVPIPHDLADELLNVLNGHPRYVFWNSGTGTEETAVKNWHHDLRRVFDQAGLKNGHPHQLRDTFAADLLAKGVPLQEVSKLLGHESTETTERYYAKWVPERQDRLDMLVMATWEKK